MRNPARSSALLSGEAMGFRSTLADVIDLETARALMPLARRAGRGRFAPIVGGKADWPCSEPSSAREPNQRVARSGARSAPVCEPPPGGGGPKDARGRKRIGSVEVIYRKGKP